MDSYLRFIFLLILLLISLLLPKPLVAQQTDRLNPPSHLHLQVGKAWSYVEVDSLFSQQESPLSRNWHTRPLLPQYARQNPAGHAPLCRLEYRIEQTWAIGLWAEADAAAQLKQGLMPQPNIQVKLLRF